ncbi:hypothetical protein BDV25DRAFT_146468 [Aspergillus avenaceus]|uniref:Reverse transcriptase domain-containing protein n=1 Tax=Aspergillus avenaceus TaxID=36643 RepID=A0A5N6U9N4_ASPAV|nr:hypothetical protein BDV25DRAFT_146468 [Aspergillus avenaceus]
MATTSGLPSVLLSLTQSKFRELEKRRTAYEAQKSELLQSAQEYMDIRDRVTHLLAGTKRLYSDEVCSTITNMERWLDQARFDSSLSQEKLQQYEALLEGTLDTMSRKFDIADLYSKLLMEWIQPPSPSDSGEDLDEHSWSSASDLLVVDERQIQRLQQLCDQFESVVFEPLETNEESIRAFLDGLFLDEASQSALRSLRKKVSAACVQLWEQKDPFTKTTVRTTVQGLLMEDLLSEEKQETLKYFLEKDVALKEVADVLNMRYADLESWDWHADGGLPVLPRQQLNGKYRIWIDDDVLQAIFTQYIAVSLCNSLKALLTDFIKDSSVWNWHPGLRKTERDGLRRQFYLSPSAQPWSIEYSRKRDYLDTHFLFHMPTSQSSLTERGMLYNDENNDGDDRSPEGPTVKQQLLRKIATEMLINRQIYGQAAVIQSDMKWYATALPHSTIFTVMRYLGFPDPLISFFQKYLAAPLNMDNSCEGRERVGLRIRKRGVPISHAMEKLTGELLLFPIDLAVNRETGLLLYRIHDDMWICGDPARCVRAWGVIQRYAKVTGLDINQHKTGSVYLAQTPDPGVTESLPEGPVTFGFLTLDARSGKWEIDQSQVDAHINQLKKQLDRSESVISWVRTWNSCIGRFFQNTFGQPAHCFGPAHVDAILSTYERMQKRLFEDDHTNGSKTVTEHLRRMVASRFGVCNVPDAFFFFPAELGGLGLRNPFLPFLLRFDTTAPSPTDQVNMFKRKEIESYTYWKKEFNNLSERSRRRRFETVNSFHKSSEPPVVTGAEMNTFMLFEEFIRYRESDSDGLSGLYEALQGVPAPKPVSPTEEYLSAYDAVSGEMGRRKASLEEKWTLQLYANDVLKRFGGLSLVEKQFLPDGILNMMKEKRVKWHMVL